MLGFFYNIAIFIITIFYLPILAYRRIFHKKYRHSLKYRFGFDFPHINKNDQKLIWVHAVSVGETKAIASLIKQIKQQQPNTIVVLSVITETGFAEGNKSIPEADYHVYLPLDLPFIIRPIVRRIRPDKVIICETDLWYNFLSESKKQGAKVFLVNGKISERSMERHCMFPAFTHCLFGLFDKICLQNDTYKARFEKMGLFTDYLKVTGNLKFDDDFPVAGEEELAEWRCRLQINDRDRVIVIGSTHNPEEELLLQALESLWKAYPDAKILLVPRHPERFDDVAGLLDKFRLSWGRLSLEGELTGKENIILIDAMGVLRQLYQLAEIAIVGGSFTDKVGGHNILEPVKYAVPILFGPYMFSQPGMGELVLKYKAGYQVDVDEVYSTLLKLLEDADLSDHMQQASDALFVEIQGALQRTFSEIV